MPSYVGQIRAPLAVLLPVPLCIRRPRFLVRLMLGEVLAMSSKYGPHLQCSYQSPCVLGDLDSSPRRDS